MKLVLFTLGAFIFPNFAHAKKSFPDMQLRGTGEQVLSPKTLKGKVTVVNLWATWCEACKVELKEMETLFKPLRKDPSFQFAMVTLDKDPEKAVAWVKENLKDPDSAMRELYNDPEFSLAEKFAGDTFPVTLIVDRNAQVVKVHEGYDEKSAQTASIAKEVKLLLKATDKN